MVILRLNPTPQKNAFIVFGPKRDLVSSLLIINKGCVQSIEIVLAACEMFSKIFSVETDSYNIHSAYGGCVFNKKL